MAWHDDRSAGVTLTAARLAHSDDAKHKVDETHVRPGRSWQPLVGGGVVIVVLAVVVGLLVTRHHDATPASAPATSRDDPSASAEASATAAPLPALSDTQPLGRYRSSVRFLVIRPPNADTGGALRSGVSRFTGDSCDANSCSGTLISSTGSRYAYSWDGTALALARQPAVETSTSQCDGGGSYSFTRTFKVAAVTVTPGAGGSPPSQFRYVLDESVTYTKPTGGCSLNANTIRFDRRVITLTRLP